jgi:hypothetical protein
MEERKRKEANNLLLQEFTGSCNEDGVVRVEDFLQQGRMLQPIWDECLGEQRTENAPPSQRNGATKTNVSMQKVAGRNGGSASLQSGDLAYFT